MVSVKRFRTTSRFVSVSADAAICLRAPPFSWLAFTETAATTATAPIAQGSSTVPCDPYVSKSAYEIINDAY
ncbi:hypothetical protein PLICRDRAFT_42997 [Plicaturopsis crispa FD-325 SS-3]|nr:hypothetical protein PLICRDRAFT_42997 [Plicaturopsis crispa FD-325 SS-3]